MKQYRAVSYANAPEFNKAASIMIRSRWQVKAVLSPSFIVIWERPWDEA